ncbi:GPW/gp25 family protein [Asticcacaulis sp. BYS171W]|uniref:GPW/gp25 family protein n=1 Tax=Asticcacaulis aquaticus TaxID=2984212 RepID=A0ABT5HTT2_9CAUL|nr:GPW/gp25 family protein [Asticcacaulis aquaticus]MDC7683270.1 GPW/gp25 family protein [Asticcacaulis aquaticus]
MSGMNVITGKAITGLDHIRQSLVDILSTPVGSRIMQRDYGSYVPGLIDAPLNTALPMKLIAATATAIRRWEPRLKLIKVALFGNAAGRGGLSITAYRLDVPASDPVTIQIPL